LADAAFALKPGELSDLIETDQAWHIMRVAARRPGAVKGLAEVRADILRTLQMEGRSAAVREWIGKLRAQAFVRYEGCGAAAAQAQDKVVRIEVRHIGVSNVTDAVIRGQLVVKAGEIVTEESLDHDIRSLYLTGAFHKVQVTAETLPGGIKLIYLVQENPVLTGIQFTGNKRISSREVLLDIESKTGEPMDERKLFHDSQRIKRLYEKAGYPPPAVKYVFHIEEGAGRARATFEIAEVASHD
jgi:outer membrane protein assembly factor BamA